MWPSLSCLLITHRDSQHDTQLWVPGEEKPRRIFSVSSVAPGCISLCRFHPGYHFTTCHKRSSTLVEASPCSFEFFSLDLEKSQYKCSAPEGLQVLEYSPSGRYLLGGDVFGRMYIWEVSTGVLLSVWDAHWKSISDICFHQDGVVFLSASEDGTLKSWSLISVTDLSSSFAKKVSPLSTFRGHTMAVTSVCCGRNVLRDWIFSCSLDGTVRVWKLDSGEWLHTYSLTYPLVCLTMHPHEAVLFTGSREGTVYQIFIYLPLERSFHSPIVSLWHQDSTVNCLCWVPFFSASSGTSSSSRKGLLTSASADGTIYVYDYSKGERIQTYCKMLGDVSNLLFVPLDEHRLQHISNATSIGRPTCIRWNVHLKRVPIALDTTTTAASGQGTSIMARYQPNKYEEDPSAIDGINKTTSMDDTTLEDDEAELLFMNPRRRQWCQEEEENGMDSNQETTTTTARSRIAVLFQWYDDCVYERRKMRMRLGGARRNENIEMDSCPVVGNESQGLWHF